MLTVRAAFVRTLCLLWTRPFPLPVEAAWFDNLTNVTQQDPCGFGNGLRRLPASDLPHNSLSTVPRQTGILVDVIRSSESPVPEMCPAGTLRGMMSFPDMRSNGTAKTTSPPPSLTQTCGASLVRCADHMSADVLLTY